MRAYLSRGWWSLRCQFGQPSEVLYCGGQREFIGRTTHATQSQAIQFQDALEVGKQQLRLSTYRSITNLPDSGWSFSMRGHTEYQPQPPGSASEISIRDRSHTPCEWGQNWGHNSIFSGCNYCPRAQSKCFLATLRVFRRHRTGCLPDHFCLSTNHGTPFTSGGLLHWGQNPAHGARHRSQHDPGPSGAFWRQKSSGIGRQFGSAFVDDYFELKSLMIGY